MDGETDLDHLPPFANAENKELNQKRLGHERSAQQLSLELEENEGRLSVMENHLKSVKAQLKTTEDLVRMKNKESETEDHLKRLADREAGRIKVELQKVAKRREDLAEKMNLAQNAIFKGEKQLEDIMSQMNWDQEELDEWLLASQQKEEDSLAMEKYTKQDQSLVKARTLAVEKITKEVEKRKTELEKEVTETQAAQIELDKTADEFKRMHKERQTLVSQWEETVEAMRKRDDAIEAVDERLKSGQAQVRQREILIDEKKRFLQDEQNNNLDCNRKINNADRKVKRYREGLSYAQEDITEYRDQVKTIENEVQKVASDVVARKRECVELAEEIESKRGRIERFERSRAEARQNLELTEGKTLSLEEKVAMLEELHKQEEAHAKHVEKAVQDVKDKVFRQSQELFTLRQKEANLIAEITGAQAAKKNLKASIHRLDHQSLKQQELIYNQEFQLQQLERKVSRAEGDRSDEEKHHLTERIGELQQQLEDQAAIRKLLSGQLKKLQDDIRRSKRKLDDGDKEDATLTVKIEELELDNDSAQRTVQSALAEKEKLMVDANVLKLEVKRLNDILGQRTDDVLALTNRRYQMQMSMQERSAEIAVHRDVLWAKMKAEEEERHRAKNELRDRLLKVEKLKNKYEIMSKRFAGEDGGEDHSQAYFVIKAAQEREELMREGDALSAKITKAEKEIRSLENTLAALGASNVGLKGSYTRADESSEEYARKVALEEQHRAAVGKLREKQARARELSEELGVLESTLSNAEGEQAGLHANLDALQQEKESLEKEVLEQREKQERSFQAMQKLARQHRAQHGSAEEETVIEKDFLVRELRDFNKGLLKELAAISERGPHDMLPQLEACLAESGMALPSRQARSTGRPSSSGSFRSQASRGSSARARAHQSTRVPAPRGASASSRPSSAGSRGSVLPLINGASSTPRSAGGGMRGARTPLKGQTQRPRGRPGSASSNASAASRVSQRSMLSARSSASRASRVSVVEMTL